MQQPVADLDRIDHPRIGAVLDEGCTRSHADVIKRWENLRSMKEDVIDVEVEVAGDGEMEGPTRPEVETEGSDSRDMAHLRPRRHGQRRCRDPVATAHLVIAMHPDSRKEPRPGRAVELVDREAKGQPVCLTERAVTQVIWDEGTTRHSTSTPGPS